MLQESGVAPDAALRQAAQEITSCMAVLPSVDLRAVRTGGASARIAVTEEGNWDREVLADPGFLEEAKRSAGSDWPVYFTVAHELGHHAKRHLEPGGLLSRVSAGRAERHAAELEADRMAGFVLYKLGASRQEVQRAVYNRTEAGSETHPPLAERREAALAGWREASEQGPPPPGCAADVTQVVHRWSFDEDTTSGLFDEVSTKDGYLWLRPDDLSANAKTWYGIGKLNWSLPSLRSLPNLGLAETGDFSLTVRFQPVSLPPQGAGYGLGWVYTSAAPPEVGESDAGAGYRLTLTSTSVELRQTDVRYASMYEFHRAAVREKLGVEPTPTEVLTHARASRDQRITGETRPSDLESMTIATTSERVIAKAGLNHGRSDHAVTLRKRGTRMEVSVDGEALHEFDYRSLLRMTSFLFVEGGAAIAVDEITVLQH